MVCESYLNFLKILHAASVRTTNLQLMAVPGLCSPSPSLPSRSRDRESPVPSLVRVVLRSVFRLQKELIE